jgi:uncharacterized protein YuzE
LSLSQILIAQVTLDDSILFREIDQDGSQIGILILHGSNCVMAMLEDTDFVFGLEMSLNGSREGIGG